MYKLYEHCTFQKQKEESHEQLIKNKAEDRLKLKCLTGWKNTSSKLSNKIQKVDKFYLQNLKIKAFFILLRYSRNCKEIRARNESERLKLTDFTKRIFFTRWKRAYTHKINMLANRK